jgi:hypothetical protein
MYLPVGSKPTFDSTLGTLRTLARTEGIGSWYRGLRYVANVHL